MVGYLSQFSMTSSALILSVYCGVSVLARVVWLGMRREFGLGEAGLGLGDALGLGVCACFFMAAVYDLGSVRIEYCGAFDLTFGLGYFWESIRSLRLGFGVLFALSFMVLCVLARSRGYIRAMLLLHSGYLALLALGYLLIVSKCGAKYYLMSGLLLSAVLVLSVWAGVIYKEAGRKSCALLGLIALVAWLYPFEPYQQRPRDAYLQHRAYAKSWVAQVVEAESSGLESVSIFVPKEFPHWQWASWFFPSFAHTLRHYGVIRREIKVEFKPIE